MTIFTTPKPFDPDGVIRYHPDGKNTHVELVYFKPSGKYYSSGSFAIPYKEIQLPEADAPTVWKPVPFWECIDIVKAMLERGERPGLVDGFGFNVLCTVYTEYGPLQSLFIRGDDKGDQKDLNVLLKQEDEAEAARSAARQHEFLREAGEPHATKRKAKHV